MATQKQFHQQQDQIKSEENALASQQHLNTYKQPLNIESQLIMDGKSPKKLLINSIYKAANKQIEKLGDFQGPISLLPPDLRNSNQDKRQTIANKLIKSFQGALAGEDFDNDILGTKKSPIRRNSYFVMSHMMQKGELVDEKEGVDDELQEGAWDEKDEFYEYKYGYMVALIDQEAYYSGNQLLDTTIKDDFELLSFYADSYPLLEERKVFMLFTTSISCLAKWIITQKSFDNFILFVIVWNSIMLAIDDPTSDSKTEITTLIETFFLWTYGVECALKIVAMGLFWDKNSYLRDSWNILDFIIVVTSFISEFSGSGGGSLASLRALRILRPLRTISTIKALKNILNTLVLAMKDMISTMIILSFFFMVFAIAGVQMFSGLLKQRCFMPETGVSYVNPDDPYKIYICGIKQCPDGYVCGKMIANPNWGVTNFDNISYSFLMVFQCVTLEGWTEIMYWLFDAFSLYIVVYFVILIFIGAFFLLNLTLAVIKAKFTQSQEGKEDEVEKDYKMELGILKHFRRMQRMFIKKNMLRNMNQDKQWGPIYTKQMPDLDTLRNQLQFSWENDIKKVQKNEQLAQQKQLEDKNQMKTPEETEQINEAIKKEKNKINQIVKHNISNKVKVMPSQMLIYHFDQDQKLPLEKHAFSPSSAQHLKSEQQESALRQYDDNSSFSQQPNKVKKQVCFMGISKNEKETSQAPVYTDKDEELNQLFADKSNKKYLESPKDMRFNLLQLTCKKIKISPKIEQYKVQDLDQSIEHSSSTRNVQPTSLNGAKVTDQEQNSGRSNSISVLPSIGLSDDSDFKDENLKQIDIQTIQEELRKQALAQKKELHKKKNTNYSISDDESDFKSQSSKAEPKYKVEIVQANKNVWHIKPDDDFKLKIKKDQEKAEREKKESHEKGHHSHHHHSTKPKSQAPDAAVQQLQSNQKSEEQKSAPKSKSKNNEHKTSSQSSSEEEEQPVKDLTESEKKALQDSQNVFNWKLKLNDVEFKSETADDILIHQIEAEQVKLEIEEQLKLTNKLYKMKYKLQKKKEEPEVKKKKTKEEMRQEIRQKMYEKKQQTIRQQKRRITANCIRKSLGLTESRFLRAYQPSLIPVEQNCMMKWWINPVFGQNCKSRTESLKANITPKEVQTGKKSKTRRLKYRNYDQDEDHQTISKFIKEPIYRSARRMMKAQNFYLEEKEEDDDEILQQIEEEPEKKKKLMEKLSLQFIFLEIKRDDYTTGTKIKTNWSGKDILQNTVGTEEHQNNYLRQLSTDNINVGIYLKGWYGLVKVCHTHYYNLINGSLFNNLMTLAVFLNTIIMAMDGLFEDEGAIAIMDFFSLIFTYTFIGELSSKLIALGPLGYLRDTMNIFDGSIVLLSLFELIFMSGGSKAVSAFRAIRIFRTFRVLRVTRLLRSLEFMAVIIQVVSKSIGKLMWVALLSFLLIFIYSLLGMQIYGGQFNYKDDRRFIRQNFDNFHNAFLVIYQLMSMENWNQVLMLAISSDDVNKFLSSIYLISWIFIGNYIFLNLFISILLDGFNVEGGNIEEDEDDDPTKDIFEEDNGNDLMIGSDNNHEHHLHQDQSNNTQNQQNDKKKSYTFQRLSTEEEKKIQDEIDANKHGAKKPLFNKIECNQSCYVFSKQNRLRIFCYQIVVHPQFENMILAFIIISSLKLVVDTYFEDASEMLEISGNIDFFFNGSFTLEATMKIIAFGLILDDNSYLTDTWSQMDFFIVCMSLIDMTFSNVDLPVIKILRLLRILRPLRFISHNINMKIVVIALLESVGAIMNVLIVVVMIMLMFAILGMSLIGGRMGYCDIEEFYGVNKETCLAMGSKWLTRDINFDNIFKAMNSLFVLSSKEGWPDYMWNAIDSDLPENGPTKNGYMIISYFFVLYIFIGSFFLINLFVGVIFLRFNEAQQSEKGVHPLASDDQKKWIEFQQMIIGVKAEFAANQQPDNPFRYLCWKLATNTVFEIFIMICIVLNIVTMGMVYDGSAVEYNYVMEQINMFFTVVFIFECALKLISFGPSGYWTSGWNQFDFFVVASSILDIIMNEIGSGIKFLKVGPQLARVMRVLRVSRLLKLVKSMESLNKTIETLTFSLPSLINVGALLLLVFFIFSVLGVFMFKKVTFGVNISNYNNFYNFGNAMISLFRISTGEDWPTVMFDFSRTAPNCDPTLGNCGTIFSIFYFILFVMFVQFIMLNLFILIIIQNFEDYNMKKGNPLETFNEKLDIFRQQWSEYSEFSNGEKIKQKDIIPFLSNLNDPLGYKTANSKKLQGKEFQDFKAGIYRDVMSWNLTDDNEGNIVFNEMLYACMKKAYGCTGGADADQTLKKLLNKAEMETKMKINEEKSKKASKQIKNTFVQEGGKNGGNDVNPMVLFIYTSMAFKCMINYKRSARTNANLYMTSDVDESYSSSSSEGSEASPSKNKSKLEQEEEDKLSQSDSSQEEQDSVDSLDDKPLNKNQSEPRNSKDLSGQKKSLKKQDTSSPPINKEKIVQQAFARRSCVTKLQLPNFM